MRPVLLWVLLLCWGSAVQADLRLQLDSRALDNPQRQASQALLDEALAVLPPSFSERLDRAIEVRWGELPPDVYGRLTGHSRLTLNRRLLPALLDGSATSEHTGRPHGTLRRELLATVLHELAHLYDRARLWPAAEWRQQRRCRSLAARLGPVGPTTVAARANGVSHSPTIRACSTWPAGRRRSAGAARGKPSTARWTAARTPTNCTTPANSSR